MGRPLCTKDCLVRFMMLPSTHTFRKEWKEVSRPHLSDDDHNYIQAWAAHRTIVSEAGSSSGTQEKPVPTCSSCSRCP